MKTRCHNERAHNYKNYGGKGVSVCDRWMRSFNAFVKDMGERPEGAVLKRIDEDGDYSPENCVWSSPSKDLELGGVTSSISEWSDKTGIPESTIRGRIKRGDTAEEALTKPGRILYDFFLVVTDQEGGRAVSKPISLAEAVSVVKRFKENKSNLKTEVFRESEEGVRVL